MNRVGTHHHIQPAHGGLDFGDLGVGTLRSGVVTMC
jgi:hypothetical protein